MKRGITVSILVLTVILMFVIVTTSTVIGTRTIQTAIYEEFLSKVQRVSDNVNKYVISNKSLPTTSEIIAKEGLANSLVEEINKNNDATNNLFVVDMTKLKAESVNIGRGSVADMDVFVVAENTNNVYYLKGIEYRNQVYHGTQLESSLKVNENGVPIKWQQNVTAIVDGVPIPKGFVASSATGENKKEAGLVIYEGTEEVNDTNVYSARRERNQYVWVPVSKAYFNSKFVRKDYINVTSKKSDILGTTDMYWEVSPTTELTTANLNYMTEDTLKEVQAMYASVKKYGGFYIARYEAGIDTQRIEKGNAADLPGIKEGTKVYSVMGKIPYTYVPWTWNNKMNEDTNGAVEIARRMYPETNTNYGVVSTLTYGVQWDRTVQWFIDTKAMTLDQVNTTEGSSAFGNYKDTIVIEGALNQGAKYAIYSSGLGSYLDATYDADGKSTITKANGTYWLLSTGALKAAKVNNIYDMAGNVFEWTMEGVSSSYRVSCGGSFYYTGSQCPLAYCGDDNPGDVYSSDGFRYSLYIK